MDRRSVRSPNKAAGQYVQCGQLAAPAWPELVIYDLIPILEKFDLFGINPLAQVRLEWHSLKQESGKNLEACAPL